MVARQQQLTVYRPRRDAISHDPLVEFAQVECSSVRRLVVAAQLERRQLAEEITALSRIVGAAHRLAARRERLHVGFTLEEPRGLLNRPLAAVQLEPRDEPADPGQ